MRSTAVGSGLAPLANDQGPHQLPSGTTEELDRPTERLLGYQPSLDGLRALAVLSVMAYHDDLHWAHAGFLGVDVFLVLSGFLITSLLIQEIRNTGTVNRVAFWSRRARRLFPALFAVLIAVGVYAVLFATPSERLQIRGDALASLLYVQNWHLIFAGQSYFAQFGTPSPLRHMWSLAIEEQWYIIWPLLFLFLFRVTRGSLAKLATITCTLAAVSAGLMILMYRPGHDPSRVYYGTDTRAQALLIGAVLAFILATRPPVFRAPWRWFVQLIGIASAIYLIHTITTANDQTSELYQGGFTIVAIATALLIVAAMGAGPVRSMLSIRPLVAVGLISYGLYLWHWPIFLLMSPARTGLTGGALDVARFAVAFAVATASYFWLERPIRRGTWTWVQRPARWAPIGAVVVALCLLIGTSNLLAPPWSANAANGAFLHMNTAQVKAVNGLAKSAAPPRPGATRFVVAGDSVAFTLAYYGIPERLQDQGWVQGATILGCGLGGRGVPVSDGVPSAPRPECASWPTTYAGAVKRAVPSVSVLLTGAWDIYDRMVDGHLVKFGSAASRRNLTAQFDRARTALTGDGAPLVLLTAPCFSPATQDLGSWGAHERSEPWRVATYNRIVREYAAQHAADVVVGDLHKVLCPGGRYTSSINGMQLRSDGVHFTKAGAAYVFRWLIPLVRRVADEHPIGRA